jgi:starch synthase
VRETGGLKDTVSPYLSESGEGMGFVFANISSHDMVWVLREAVELYHKDREKWIALRKNCMSAELGWGNSAQKYIEIYAQVMGRE